MSRFRDRRVTVMGLGAFGGGEGVVRFLCERGARVTVTDLKSESELAETLDRLADCRIESLHLGEHRDADFSDAELVVVNPAVPRGNPFLALAAASGVPLTSEMNLFVEHNRGRVLAVTGSIGKSTTTALIENMLTAAGRRTWLGGNIGRSLLPVVDEIAADDWVVLELSSFQLTDLNRLQFRPDVAVVTNLSPNHLDWHASIEEYRSAKQTILRWQQPGDVAVLNADDADVSQWPVEGRTIWFGTNRDRFALPATGSSEARSTAQAGVCLDETRLNVSLPDANFTIDLRSGFHLPGAHNAMNAAAATAAAGATGVGQRAILEALNAFKALPHRLQFIGEFRGRRFYDDSKATTPEAAMAALNSFESPIVLLAGGYDKHIDLSDLAARICERTKAVALLGQTAPLLAQQLARQNERFAATGGNASRPPNTSIPESFPEAVHWAIKQSAPGDVVLLSPGCASYGWFPNYVHRGRDFSDLVQAWGEEGAAAQER